MTFMRGMALACGVAALVGCGSGPGSFKGSVDDKELSVADAIFIPLRDDDGATVGASLLMSDAADLCATLKAGRKPKSATYFVADIYSINAQRDFLAPDVNDYTVTMDNTLRAGKYAFAAFTKFDANCTETVDYDTEGYGKSGIVKVTTLENVKDGIMKGTFDITFGDQADKVTGSFSADFCDAGEVDFSQLSCE